MPAKCDVTLFAPNLKDTLQVQLPDHLFPDPDPRDTLLPHYICTQITNLDSFWEGICPYSLVFGYCIHKHCTLKKVCSIFNDPGYDQQKLDKLHFQNCSRVHTRLLCRDEYLHGVGGCKSTDKHHLKIKSHAYNRTPDENKAVRAMLCLLYAHLSGKYGCDTNLPKRI